MLSGKARDVFIIKSALLTATPQAAILAGEVREDRAWQRGSFPSGIALQIGRAGLASGGERAAGAPGTSRVHERVCCPL